MSAINEALIRDVVAEVMGRLGQAASVKPAPAPSPAPPAATSGSGGDGKASRSALGRGKYGVFQDANEACAAAHEGYLQLREKGVAARAKVVEIVKTMAEARSSRSLSWFPVWNGSIRMAAAATTASRLKNTPPSEWSPR
jgi:hypothetical protein